MPRIELGFTAPAVIIIALLVASFGFASLVYRFTLPPVARSKKLVLAGLRGLALAMLIMLLFEPFLRVTFTSMEPPVLAVLIDNSESMSIADRGSPMSSDPASFETRSALLTRLLHGKDLADIARRADVRYYSFGSMVRHLEHLDPDSLTYKDDRTDISSALHTVAADRAHANIHAVVLLSDGGYNIGPNPVYEAENLGVPLYTIGIGDSTEHKDILITKILTNDLVFAQIPVPVDVTVKSSGFNDEPVSVGLSDGTHELARATLTLQPGTREYDVPLSYTPEGEGTKKFTVQVSPLPGELTTANNRKVFYAKVLKSRLNVLIISGGPGPDLSVVRQTLSEEKSMDVHSFTQKTGEGTAPSFYEGQLPRAAIDSADCIILIGVPTAATSGQVLRTLQRAFEQRAKPLLFVNGKTTDNARLQDLGSILPFVAVNSSSLEQFVFFHPSEDQRMHPVLALGEGSGLGLWDRLPPLFRTESTYRAKIDAVVLGFSKVQNTILKEPLMVARTVGGQKALAFLGYGIWRWRLMAQGSPETQQVLATFLVNSVRWLTTREDNRTVKVAPTRETFSEGEPAEFFGQVYNASAEPVNSAQVIVITRQGERTIETELKPLGNGRYEGSVDGLTTGDYTFTAVAHADGLQLGEDKGRFSVGNLNLEFQDTRMNPQILRQIADAAGGEYFTAGNAGVPGLAASILSQSSFAPRTVVRTNDVELWNWRYTLAMIVLLVSVEWFVRKRSGML